MSDWFLFFSIPLFLVFLIVLGLFLVLTVGLLLAGIATVIDYVRR